MARAPRIRIRRAVDADVPQIRELDRLCFPSDSPGYDAEAVWWCARTLREDVVAFAAIRASQQWAGVGYLNRCGVHDAWRGLGLQRRLLRAREAYARQQGWSYVVTDTTPENTASANNLIRAGFTLYQPRHPWGLRRALYWIKAL